MGLRSRLSRLERTCGAAAVDAFCRRWGARQGEPTASATDALLSRMVEVEAAIGRGIRAAEWLDDAWMAGHGLDHALNRLLRAVEAGGDS